MPPEPIDWYSYYLPGSSCGVLRVGDKYTVALCVLCTSTKNGKSRVIKCLPVRGSGRTERFFLISWRSRCSFIEIGLLSHLQFWNALDAFQQSLHKDAAIKTSLFGSSSSG